MEDYFEDMQGETISASQISASRPQTNEDHEFHFANEQSQQNYQIPNYSDNFINDAVEDEIARRVRQEEQKINYMLKEKADKEYQSKQKRKEQGRRQLEEFLESKQREKKQRKQENIRDQERNQQNTKNLNEKAGWKKVAANIGIKQGQYKGNKDINRMRESILHKRDDQS